MSEAHYAIGVDLGTTHCALCYTDLKTQDTSFGMDRVTQTMLPIPQHTGAGALDSLPLLPSFLYLPHADELSRQDLALPWRDDNDLLVGTFARDRGANTPIRLVSSAKSWLCHPGIDRRAGVLPLQAPDDVAGLSPFMATQHYLAHLRAAWDHAHPWHPFDEQTVTLTIPASFDPAARQLTAEAAEAVGYRNLTLLEEPQAALYSWVQASQGEWRQQVRVGDTILVVDVGGGTTDFSLIAVLEKDGNLELHRIAVGDHILLGGDNMDLTLAHQIADKLAAGGTQLDAWQLRALTHGCRQAKETLLSNPDLPEVPIVVPSRGAKLIQGSLRTELTRAEVQTTLVEGFFPSVEVSARPAKTARGALTQMGLPYAQEPAITRHLAAFLSRQTDATADLEGFAPLSPPGASFLHPTALLFNGGGFKSRLLAERGHSTLNQWLANEGSPPARLLGGTDLDLAVARGAAYYSYVRQGGGVRIRGGTAKAYYVGVESAAPAIPGRPTPIHALCIAPFGLEEGSKAPTAPQQLGLIVGEPVRFRFFGSSVRRHDQVGDQHDRWNPEEIEELGEIEVTLPAEGRDVGEIVPVQAQAMVTETGTLRLDALPTDGEARWRVELDVRNRAA